MVIAQPYELKYCEVVLYLPYRLWDKNDVVSGNIFNVLYIVR